MIMYDTDLIMIAPYTHNGLSVIQSHAIVKTKFDKLHLHAITNKAWSNFDTSYPPFTSYRVFDLPQYKNET